MNTSSSASHNDEASAPKSRPQTPIASSSDTRTPQDPDTERGEFLIEMGGEGPEGTQIETFKDVPPEETAIPQQ